MINNTTIVGMADISVVKCPFLISTLGLGSCIGIVLYDPFHKIGGLAHIMLPSSIQMKHDANKYKFADTAIVSLVNNMVKTGADVRRIVAKIAGGSQMFTNAYGNDVLCIGKRNAISTKEVLELLRIPIIAEDIGGNYGRTIILDTNTGVLTIKSLGKGIKEI